MALSLISQELFDSIKSGYSVYSGSNSGSFSSFVGTISASQIGPASILTASTSKWGYSAKSGVYPKNEQTYGIFNFNDGPVSAGGMICGWFNLWYDNSDSPAHGTSLLDVTRNQGANSFFGTLSTYNRNLYLNYGNVLVSTGSIIPHQWIWLAVSWYNTGGSNRVMNVFKKTLGEPSASFLYQYVNAFAYSGQPYTSSIGFSNSSGTAKMIGRFGAASLYSMDSQSFANKTIPTDIIDPPMGPYTWYVNPYTGDDTNDGLSPTSSWKSEVKLRNELNLYQGIFGNVDSSSFGTGDKIILDTSTIPFNCQQYGISLNKPGLWLTSAQSSSLITTSSYAKLNPYNIIPNTSWSLISNKINTYTSNQISYVSDCVVWENDLWMTPISGTTYNSVSNSLETTSGSYFQDGVNIYIHPFGNTNPITDNKIYTKSNILLEPLNTTTGSSVINIGNINSCYNILVEQMYVTKSATNNSAGGLWPSYGLNISNNVYGNNLIKNCYFNYNGKHGCGITTNATPNTNITFSGVQSEQSLGGNSFIVFATGGTTLNNNVLFDNCKTLKSNYRIGSANGDINGSSILGHNSGGKNQFSNVYITNCNFVGGNMELFSTAVDNTVVVTTTGSGVISSAGTCSIDRCRIGLPFSNVAPMICKNSIITVDNNYAIGGNDFNNLNNKITSPMTISNCTFDLTSINLTSVSQNQCIFLYGSGSSINFNNNIFINPQNNLILYGGFPSGSIISDYNLYCLSSSNTSLSSASFNSGSSFQTLQDFKSYGIDRHSNIYTNSSSLLLNSNYQPQDGSPVINNGNQQSYYYDITGNVFTSRLTVGAYEYIYIPSQNTVLVYSQRQGTATTSGGQQTVNDVQLTHPQTVKEVKALNDPYILSLLEHLEYLRAKKSLTPQLERNLHDEISGRMMFLYNS